MLGRHLCYHYTIGANNYLHSDYQFIPDILTFPYKKTAVDWPLGAIPSHPHSHFNYLSNSQPYVWSHAGIFAMLLLFDF
jgi:hypothetical protein